MSKNPLELPEDRPATLDEFGRRVWLYPAAVKGYFRKRRSQVQFVLMAIFLLLPWLKINGEQALLLNLPQRKFAFFGLALYAHDAPLFFFLIASFVFALAFATAVFGRVWCGWACPQTVFIDGLFRRIETWVEGSHLERRKLDQGPMTAGKIAKKSLKWALFALCTLVLTHSFLAYFIGAEELALMIRQDPSQNWTPFLVMSFTSAVLLFDLAWFREQFCIIMCPYGRFQSVLMDHKSLAVIYDAPRGEPRKGVAEKGQEGDCVNCYRCVQVCPTGIDIRRGIQLECIACTACIDACDEIMEKVKKPKGLIRYSSEWAIAKRWPGLKIHWHRPWALIYLALFAALILGLGLALAGREGLHAAVLRAQDVPYKVVPNPAGGELIINHFKLHLKNQSPGLQTVQIKLSESLVSGGAELVMPDSTVNLKDGADLKAHFFVKFRRELLTQVPKDQWLLVLDSGENIQTRALPLLTP